MHFSLALCFGLLQSAAGFPHLSPYGDRVLADNHQPGRPHGITNSTLKPNHFTWSPPGEQDVRAPCPMLNTLANHGFLPHNGRNITRDMVVRAFKDGLNISPDLASGTFDTAITANPTPNATWFDLEMLHTHNLIEHDGSLSRRDAYFDPSNRFDEETFDNFLSYFGNASILGVNETADARARHAYDMSKINPNFTLTEEAFPVAVGENLMMMFVWGSVEQPGANRTFFEYFFRNERFPVTLGWAPGATEIGATTSAIFEQMLSASPDDIPLTFPVAN
ncbi:Deoxyribonuclease TatD-related protein [Lasiodiplodia theobromae]|uniref:Deoxyribonuclease TatD-related protein n=1 Tax=Lasiodiplodia theobromae TaxID=45133 RepID=A0A8H7IP79_9PEZI|nr:Deoxyribonuclease TatD-related protein [Lasiodiplodia theobromae]